MSHENISDEYLNSYVDDQLDSGEKTQAFELIRQNENLKERVCELRAIKEAVQHAYKRPPAYTRPAVKQQYPWKIHFQPLAACLLLLAGGLSGWFTHAWSNRESRHDITTMLQATQHSDAMAETRKIIVHVSNSNPVRLKAALDETEALLDTYKHANSQIQVELIASRGGADLLRSNVSAYERRISLMQEKYPNLSFLVCGQTISKLQNEGKTVPLLPHTGVASSAADQIGKRLLQGWGYIRI